MRNAKGFTLIELMIVIAIIMAAIGMFFGSFKPIDPAVVENRMVEYVNTIYVNSLTEVSASCAKRDSDGNGYVRCTGAGTDENGERKIIIAECDTEACTPIQGVDR